MLYWIFKINRHFIQFVKCGNFIIQNFEFDESSQEWVVTFFAKRQIFVKLAKEIISNEALITKFSPVDAAKIGMHAAQSFYNKIAL